MDPQQDLDPRETQIVALLTAARERDRAPASLRAHIERDRTAARRRSRPVYAAAVAGALAALVAVLAVALFSGAPGAPTVAQAAALAGRGPVQPAPLITRQGQGTRLGESVDEVYFPDWHATIGWRAVGKRTDTLSGRHAVTVYYARGAHQVAYTIVATPPLPEPSAQRIRAGSLTLRVLHSGGRTAVTWRRAGDTCVLSASDLSAQTLAALAAWSDEPGTV